MPKRVLLVQNIAHEGPGLVAEVLSERGVSFDVLEINDARRFPKASDYAAVVVFGGPDSANDSTVKMQNELQGIRQILEQEVPYLGICLGMQVLVKAAGGRVFTHTCKEVGFREPSGDWFTVELTAEGRKDPLFQGLQSPLPVFQLHGETVELPPHARLLATGRICKIQGVRIGEKAYGLQCHFELSKAMFADWMHVDPDLQALPNAALQRDCQERWPVYRETGLTILRNFFAGAGV